MSVHEALQYTFSTATTEPPTGNQLRVNASDPLVATKIWVRYTTDGGFDAYRFLLLPRPDVTQLYLQDKNNHLQYALFDVTGEVVDKGDYVEYTVNPLGGAGLPFGNNQEMILLIAIADEEDVGPGFLGPLVDLETAKQELRVTHTEEDALITRKLEEAQALVLDYLKIDEPSPFAPETPWTSVTVPPVIRAAILQTLVDLDRHRGDDDPAPDILEDADAWPSPRVKGWLRRWRDPSYA